MPRHLAQLNLATMLAPLTDPIMSDFVAGLDRINALADRAPGFVWRLQSEGGGSPTDIRPLGDDVLINMSVWTSVEHLHAYVYRSDHVAFLRARRKWFSANSVPTTVLWWITPGHVPSVEEGLERLQWLRTHGPSERAFTFRTLPRPAQPLHSECP